MKRIILALLAVLCSVALAESVDVTGKWYVVEVRQDGFSYNPEAMGVSYTLMLGEDGTMRLFDGGRIKPIKAGTWEWRDENAIMTSNGVIGYQEDHLHLNAGGHAIFVFGRDPAEAAVLQSDPQPVAAESEEDFLGTWKESRHRINGTFYPAGLDGHSNTMTIKPGLAISNIGGTVIENTTVFSDGMLVLYYDGNEVGKLTLNDDGTISDVLNFTPQYELLRTFSRETEDHGSGDT